MNRPKLAGFELTGDNIMPESWDSISNVNFDDRELVLNTLWRHYKDMTLNWTSQPALLPQKTILPLTSP